MEDNNNKYRAYCSDYKGNVREVETIYYSLNNDNKITSRSVDSYNHRGYLIRNEWQNLIKGVWERDITYYTYREEERLEIRTEYSTGKKYEGKFDDYGRMIKSLFYDMDGEIEDESCTFENSYDEKGNLNTEKCCDYKGVLAFTATSKYDNQRNLVEKNTYYSDDHSQKLLWKYDNKGKQEQVVALVYTDNSLTSKGITKSYLNNQIHESYDSDDKLEYTYISSSDKYGNLISLYWYDENGELMTEESVVKTYTYDEHGNWIRCVDEDGNICVRKFEYYD